jgi:hypothetical protein
MKSLTQRKPARKPSRSARLARVGTATVLWITQGQDTTAYRVQPLNAEFGAAAFRLTRAIKGDGVAEVYDVLLDGDRSLCDCKGFLKHGMCKDGRGCKHIASLAALIAAGHLPPLTLAPLDPIDQDALADGEARSLEPWDDI